MDAARETWRTIGGELVQLGLLAETDLMTFAVYCQTAGRWRQAEELLGRVELPARAAAMPLLARIAAAACREMVTLGAEFGLTPLSRSRLGAGLDHRGGKFDGFLG
jgi:P27 family predicted phage terminase small subunit